MANSVKTMISFLFSKFFRSQSGQSLAEFAVITAMMATFIATAIPKFSEIMESGKGQKSIDEIDKILLQAKNFYESTAALEGRGRLPGQDKYDMPVGSYSDTTQLFLDLENFASYSNTLGEKWISVFGTDNPKALMSDESNFQDDTLTENYTSEGEILCGNCPEGRMKGADEWLDLFNREVIVSPFQDGHYIYIVIPGGDTGNDTYAPKICVADAESPKFLYKIMDL
tara:strand:- start:278 stop:958 length:681 start_codon:yes stop_codon:yes gene_type:complete